MSPTATTQPSSRLSPETSLYLDAVRFTAALVVFLGHFATHAISGGVFWQLAPFRHDSVIVFFVLSGFVIAHAVNRSEHTAGTYFVNRAARIYSVAIPATIIAIVLNQIALSLKPDYCTWGCSSGTIWQQAASSLTFTNQVWHVSMFPGSDGPYWSLGYEVPYYAIFGLAMFGRGPWRIVLPLALMLACGPNIMVLFPLWLLGWAIYRLGTGRLSEPAGWTLFIGSILAWAAIQSWALRHDGWILHTVIPNLDRDRIPADYVTGLAFAANIVGFRAIGHRFTAICRRYARPIRWLAAQTFTLYLLHFPVMRFLATFLPWGRDSFLTRSLALLGTVVVVLIVASLFEQRKQPWRRFFTALFGLLRLPA